MAALNYSQAALSSAQHVHGIDTINVIVPVKGVMRPCVGQKSSEATALEHPLLNVDEVRDASTASPQGCLPSRQGHLV